MDPQEKAFIKSLPDRRLSEARQEFLLSELIDKTRQEDLKKYGRHLKPYLPLLAKIITTSNQPPKETPEA